MGTPQDDHGGQGGHRAGASHRDGDSLRPGALLHEPSNAGCHHGLDGGAGACRRRPGVPANPGRCHLCLSDLLGLPKMRAVHFLRLSLSKIGWGGRIHTGGQNKKKKKKKKGGEKKKKKKKKKKKSTLR